MTASRLAAAVAGLLTALLLQASLVGPLTFPVPVSLPALLVVVVGIYAGPGVGIGFGFATGLVADLGSQHPAGVQALCLLGAGLVAGKLGGLAVQRGYRTRGVAALAAAIATGACAAGGLLLSVLGSHAATLPATLLALVPVGLTDALLGLLVVPAVRRLLRAQGVRAPRPATRIVTTPPLGGSRVTAAPARGTDVAA
ncbi:MAG TPA: rod shape-determining protein MreD [Jatrophihabitans sp.]|nr:rod shape-determining protein MreD [Jatrophihabitans sp.]